MNPIINSPYEEPKKHFRFDERGMSQEIVEWRRSSAFFIPVAKPKVNKNDPAQTQLDSEWTSETLQENEFINRVRQRVSEWRNQGWPGVTNVTRDLLEHWTNSARTNRLFFCQIEALETLMYVIERAKSAWDHWIETEIRDANEANNPKLMRLALKMATWSGKTVVMSMIIAWQALNKVHNRQDTRFSDAFVIIAPGITIRDRLNVLQPGIEGNYYEARDIVPLRYREQIGRAAIVITNYHSFMPRERFTVNSTLKKTWLVKREAVTESPSAMLNRVLRSIKGKSNVLVINDEAHHCYREKPAENKEVEREIKDSKKESEENNEAARVWISGIEAMADKGLLNGVVDLSATPSYLKGSWYREGTLFPWIVSDFSLIDAIECGIVKIPRLPTYQNTTDKEPSYRNLWVKISESLPKRGKSTGEYSNDIQLPKELEWAISELYSHYRWQYEQYLKIRETHPEVMPPVMIFVCNNTTVSEMVYKYVSGYETLGPTGQTGIVPGKLEIFRNEKDGNWLNRPNSLIVDSAQLEAWNQVDDAFKKTFGHEIDQFKREYRERFPGRDEPTEAEMLREVMNTVGKRGKLGEHIKCVVSVSMLTEGWDVNTVTHVLGIRAFSSQLLCEQVVGRALRRMSYAPDDRGMLSPEYAEIYGVPFNFVPGNGSSTMEPPKEITRVRALESRAECEIEFPRVEGYRYEVEELPLKTSWSDDLRMEIENFPTETTVEPIAWESYIAEPEDFKKCRPQEITYTLAAKLLNRFHRDKDGSVKYWLFPKIKEIAEEYVEKMVTLKDGMFIGLLMLSEYQSQAVANIQRAIVRDVPTKKLLPILAHYDQTGSSKYVDFTTTKSVTETAKSHVSHVVEDSDWERQVQKRFEEMDEVTCYVKNQGLDFSIPYDDGGRTRRYVPDFIVRLDRWSSRPPLNLVVEVTGKKDDKKKAKVHTAKFQWIPAVNNAKKFGEWAFLEIQDTGQTVGLIKAWLERWFESIYHEYLSGEVQN